MLQFKEIRRAKVPMTKYFLNTAKKEEFVEIYSGYFLETKEFIINGEIEEWMLKDDPRANIVYDDYPYWILPPGKEEPYPVKTEADLKKFIIQYIL
jgi:hypothetical protein